MAILFRRSNGVYYHVTCQKGKRIWRSTGKRNRLEAEKFLRNVALEGQNKADKESRGIRTGDCNSKPVGINYCFIPRGDCLPLHQFVISFIFNPVRFQAMRSIASHTIAIGRALTFVFFLASSSFAGIFHICVIDASEYCNTSDASNHNACPSKQHPMIVTAICIQNIHAFRKNAVPGGFNLFQAVEKKDTKSQNVKAIAFISSAFDPPSADHTGSWFNRSYSECVFPRSVELYKLNATLLI